MPAALPVEKNTMMKIAMTHRLTLDYASVVFAGFMVLSAVCSAGVAAPAHIAEKVTESDNGTESSLYMRAVEQVIFGKTLNLSLDLIFSDRINLSNLHQLRNSRMGRLDCLEEGSKVHTVHEALEQILMQLITLHLCTVTKIFGKYSKASLVVSPWSEVLPVRGKYSARPASGSRFLGILVAPLDFEIGMIVDLNINNTGVHGNFEEAEIVCTD
ncbi:hypothetical protein M422DRAFT_48934 [Sphaerobolus stellatus SS14]|uniref:Uncharacterized protein n=1 Tax=Sphaerobolus stellatus (strain SS14) TaxID=990650 RepID=A0A0C9VHQ5_SPHS4|nr:hypothetical protein M422DRAFT_48934 [Sphaerobolus stellatus SS14]